MKITDPCLWPEAFELLSFEHVDDDPRGQDVYAAVIDRTVVGELAEFRFGDLGVLTLDDGDDYAIPCKGGCWSLELTGPGGRLTGTHVLCMAAGTPETARMPVGGVAVWATLMVMWETADRIRQKG